MLTRWLLWTFGALALLDTAVRVVLLGSLNAFPPFSEIALVLGGGVLRDLSVIAVGAALPIAGLALIRPPLLANRWWRWALATVVLGVATFDCAIEWFFFDEFNSRFNHIALDYVLFPYEVLTNIWQSYNVPLFVVVAAIVGGVMALPTLLMRVDEQPRVPFRLRWLGVAGALCCAGVGLLVLTVLPDGLDDDRQVREIALNGMQTLVRAARTSHLDYAAFYATDTTATAQQSVMASRETGVDVGFPQRRFTAVGHPGRSRPDVVVVLEESLGAEFIGALGDRRGLSPGFDRWTTKGLLLTNLYATGNRTVRGMEGVLCSFPPLPGDAIVKRDRTDGVASMAQVFRHAGYRTEFVYGGAAAFDNLGPFAAATGYQEVRDDGILGTGAFPAESFRTAWGVADEHLFTEVLNRQRLAVRADTPLFLTALTVSNHKPFLLPPGHGTDPAWNFTKLIRHLSIFGGILVASGAIIWWGRRWLGLGLAIGLSVVALVGYGVYANQRMKPSGTRAQAVAYSVASVTAWLDKAQAKGLLAHTIVLVVGDHGARVYGSQQFPLASYRVPALLLTPEAAWQGQSINRLCSQIDLAPTLLSLAGISYTAPFFGEDLLSRVAGSGDAFVQHNRDVAAMDDTHLVELGLRKAVTSYVRVGPGHNELQECPPVPTLTDLAKSTFQIADRLYRERAYILPPLQARPTQEPAPPAGK